MTQTEIISWTIFGFVYLVLLLYFIRALLRGPKPIHWRRFSLGVFVEKTKNKGEEDDRDD